LKNIKYQVNGFKNRKFLKKVDEKQCVHTINVIPRSLAIELISIFHLQFLSNSSEIKSLNQFRSHERAPGADFISIHCQKPSGFLPSIANNNFITHCFTITYNGRGLIKRWRLKRFSYSTERSYEKARKFPNPLSASVLLTPCYAQ